MENKFNTISISKLLDAKFLMIKQPNLDNNQIFKTWYLFFKLFTNQYEVLDTSMWVQLFTFCIEKKF
jgi:hypothetical protein